MPDTDDRALGEPEKPDTGEPEKPDTGAAVINLAGAAAIRNPEPTAANMLTIDELLEDARLPEDYARICLRADLEAEHNRLILELGAMISSDGELLEDDETSLGEETTKLRAQEKADRLEEVRKQMAASTRYVLFRGLSSDDLKILRRRILPTKGEPNDAQIAAFHDALVAECAINPQISEAQMRTFRGKLGDRAIQTLIETANKVCVTGGVNVPKLPAALLNLARQ